MKIKLFNLQSLVVISIIFFSLWGCSFQKSNKVNVLVSLPLTGDAAAYGKLLKDGIEYGLSEMDEKTQSKINVIYQDDKLSTKDAINILNQEMAKQELSVVMTSSTELAMNLGSICNKNKIVLLPPIADGDNITKAGKYVYLITPVSSFQGKELARYISKDGHKNVAVIYLNDAWGNSLSSEFKIALNEYNGVVLISEACNPGQRDFRTQLTKIKNQKPDAFLIILHPTETIPLLKQVKELNFSAALYGGDTFSNKALYSKDVVELIQGIKFTLPSQPNNEIFNSFRKGFKEKYGYEADINAAAARDGIFLVGKAIERGANNGTDIINIFQSWTEGLVGATGLIKWNENRNVVSKQYSLYFIKEYIYLPFN